MTSTKSTQCTNSVWIGTKISSIGPLRMSRTRQLAETRLKQSQPITPSMFTRRLASPFSRNINCSSPCKCASSFKCPRVSSTKMSGTSSSLEDKYWIDQHNRQSLHLIGYLKLHGTMLRSLKSQFQKHSLKYRIVSLPIQRIGTSGTTPSNLIHQREPPYPVSGTQNARTSSRK